MHQVRVTFAGDGFGMVDECTSSCTIDVAEGDDTLLHARTPEAFTGWPSPCLGLPGDFEDCELGHVTANLDLTATFMRDPHELATVLPSEPASVGAFVPNGDLIVLGPAALEPGNALFLSRVTQQGATVWSHDATNVYTSNEVAVRVGTQIYALTDFSLTATSLDGQLQWSTPMVATPIVSSPSMLALTPTDQTMVITRQGVDDRANGGAVVWTRPETGQSAVAASAAGIVAAALADGTIARFDANGNALPSFNLPHGSTGEVGIAFDRQGGVAVHQSSAAVSNLTRLDANGALVFAAAVPQANDGDPVLVGIGSNDTIATAVPHYPAGSQGPRYGAQLQVHAPTGELLWSLDKPSNVLRNSDGTSLIYDAVVISDLECTPAGVCALFGEWVRNGAPAPWIELFQL